MDQTLITVLRYSITYYQNDLFICAQYANKHKATALHKAYWLPCLTLSVQKVLEYFQPRGPPNLWISETSSSHLS